MVFIKKNCIFVSIASYRDKKCSSTLQSLYENAKHPQNVYVGICEQNKFDQDQDCVDDQNPIIKPFRGNIRIMRVNHYEAQGPQVARYYCSTLWSGEEFFLQVDSHSLFSPDWDIKCIEMIHTLKKRGVDKPMLSHYPKSYDDYAADTEQYKKDPNSSQEVTRICKAFYNDRDMISLEGAGIKTLTKDQLVQVPFAAGGMIFSEYTMLQEVPYDPRMPYLFVAEEILESARCWTHGYDIYSPSQNIVYHYYTRENEDKIWTDNKTYSDMHAFNKAKLILALSDAPNKNDLPDYITYNIEKYGVGTIRSLDSFYEFIGADRKNKTISRDFCTN